MSDYKVFPSLTIKLKNYSKKHKKTTSIMYLRFRDLLEIENAEECFLEACNIGNIDLMDTIYKKANTIDLDDAFVNFCKLNNTNILSIQVADWFYNNKKTIINNKIIEIIENSNNNILRYWLKMKKIDL